jgi:hypothetical protein
MLKKLDIARFIQLNSTNSFILMMLVSFLWIPLFLFGVFMTWMLWAFFNVNTTKNQVLTYFFLGLSVVYLGLIIFLVMKSWALYLNNLYAKALNWLIYGLMGAVSLLIIIRVLSSMLI